MDSKSTTDVHRLIDNKLPPGSVCTGVTMTSLDEGAAEEYVAIINGEEVIVEAPAEESASDVADADRRAGAPEPPRTRTAVGEPTGAQRRRRRSAEDGRADVRAEAEEEYEYDDVGRRRRIEEDEDFNAPPKPRNPSRRPKRRNNADRRAPTSSRPTRNSPPTCCAIRTTKAP